MSSYYAKLPQQYLTLDAFSRIMRYPAEMFMGVKLPVSCDPLDCNKRNAYVEAAETAMSLIEQQLGMRGKAIADTSTVLTATVPVFNMGGYTPYTLTPQTISAPVPSISSPSELVTITVTLPEALDECAELHSLRILFDDVICKRLDAEIYSITYDADLLTITFNTRAYNLIDIENMGAGMAPGSTIYLGTINVEVVTKTVAVPTIKWDKLCQCEIGDIVDCVDQGCTIVEGTGCLVDHGNDFYDVRFETPTDVCTLDPFLYTVSVMSNGLWESAWADAVVSLMNTRIPVDWCACDPAVNRRYAEDNGTTDRFARTYPYAFANPFGILAPGAQYAWKVINAKLSGTIVVR